MTVAELKAALAGYPDDMRVVTEDRDGWLMDRLAVEQRTTDQFALRLDEPVVVIW